MGKTYLRTIKCPTCKGKGRVLAYTGSFFGGGSIPFGRNCGICDGTGEVEQEVKMKDKILYDKK